MPYLPVYCDSCSRTSLASEEANEAAVLSCCFCERAGRVIVGPAYGERDLLAFAEIEQAVSQALLDGIEADILSGLIQEWLDERVQPSTVLGRMLDRLPSLEQARGAIFDQPTRAVGMLLVMISARIHAPRRQSGAFSRGLLGIRTATEIKRGR